MISASHQGSASAHQWSVPARLVELSIHSGQENMAIDQAILERVNEDGIATLRFYGWAEPTLSLGYFQRFADRDCHGPSRTAACVRRATGGGAILHDRELTYSFTWPNSTNATGANATGAQPELYRRIHQAIIETLYDLGINATRFGDSRSSHERLVSKRNKENESFLCFERRTDDDIVLSGYKIAGSAQRTTRNAVLQHGSIMWGVSPYAPELPGIANLVPSEIDACGFADRLQQKIGTAFGIVWETCKLDPALISRANSIAKDRFADRDWTIRR